MATMNDKSIRWRSPADIAVDASLEQRPGVPMEKNPPRPAGNAHWETPDKQTDPGFVMRRKGLDELTPVFGTSCPPHGVSGAMRRAAYAVPEHFTSHWLILLLADRIDALEGRVRRTLPYALPIFLVGLGIATLVRRRR